MNCLRAYVFLAVMLIAVHAAARADVGVVLANPTHIGSSEWTHAGHSSVYVSAVCAETPIHLRPCRSGEQGSIVSTFPQFDEREPYGWNAVPLSLYLYGSMDADVQPLYASPALHRARESVAASGFLRPVCEGSCPPLLHAYWRDMVDATTERDIYIFAVHTTPQQDAAFIRAMNALPNQNHYRAMTNNCADFTRDLVNLYFPHAVHRDVLNDLGMMSPKSAARTFTRYAKRHPRLGLYVIHYIQQPGVVRRSGTAQVGTEAAFHQPKYLLPAALIGDHEVAGSFFVAYFLTARFGLQHTYEHFAATESDPHADASTVGTERQWDTYRERFAGAVASAVDDGTLQSAKELHEVYAQFNREAIPAIDPQGHAWLVWHPGTPQELRVGVEWSNITAPDSDAKLAQRLLLARMDAELRGPAKQRPPVEGFAREWSLLETLQRSAVAIRESRSGGGDVAE